MSARFIILIKEAASQINMELYINLNNQRNKRSSKKTFRIFSVITLGISVSMAVLLIFDISGSQTLLWFYMFYWLLISISLYMQSYDKHLFDLLGKSYFKIDEWGIECKVDLFNSGVTKVPWQCIEDMKIRLFEVDLKVGDQWVTINLEKLSDDNLKIVKHHFQEYQKSTLDKAITSVA